jgi:hypothetical protein
MLIFGEINVFCLQDAQGIVSRMHRTLREGGLLLLEPSTFASIQQEGQENPTWYTSNGGLFSDNPHLCLTERFWDEARHTLTSRYHVIDAASGAVTSHAASYQAYTDGQYRDLVEACGFADVAFYPSLTGEEDESQANLFGLVARKPQAVDRP